MHLLGCDVAVVWHSGWSGGHISAADLVLISSQKVNYCSHGTGETPVPQA